VIFIGRDSIGKHAVEATHGLGSPTSARVRGDQASPRDHVPHGRLREEAPRFVEKPHLGQPADGHRPRNGVLHAYLSEGPARVVREPEDGVHVDEGVLDERRGGGEHGPEARGVQHPARRGAGAGKRKWKVKASAGTPPRRMRR
jgi:hypothetical protein